MKQFIIFIFLITLLTSCIGSGDISEVKGSGIGYFPHLTGIDLMGEKREIPTSFQEKYNIIAVAFKRKQQEDVNSWINIIDTIITENDNIGFYEIPLIYEVNKPYRFWINNGMRSGIPDLKARLRTITVYTNRDKFLSLMNMKTDRIYTLLINRKGKILWQSEGVLDHNKEQSLINYIKNFNN